MTARRLLRRLGRSDRGASLVEYALAVALFLALFFALLDFGRLLYNWNMTEKAVQIAARMAATRPAVCPGVPTSNARGTSTVPSRFGDTCQLGSGVCAGDEGGAARVDTCLGNVVSPTAEAIWTRIDDLMPAGATRANLRYSYSFDPQMNFLGGPYVPVVTVEVTDLTFDFTSPILGLARLAAGTAPGPELGDIPFPSMSVSLPGEDLALGDAG